MPHEILKVLGLCAEVSGMNPGQDEWFKTTDAGTLQQANPATGRAQDAFKIRRITQASLRDASGCTAFPRVLYRSPPAWFSAERSRQNLPLSNASPRSTRYAWRLFFLLLRGL